MRREGSEEEGVDRDRSKQRRAAVSEMEGRRKAAAAVARRKTAKMIL